MAPLLFSMIPLLVHLNLFQHVKKKEKNLFSLKSWKGLWITEKGQVVLEINEKSNIFINNKPLELTLQNILHDELIFQDHYGYSMNLTKKNENKLLLFDEAEEKEYSFYRIAK